MPTWVSNIITIYHANPVVINNLNYEAGKTFSALFEHVRPHPDTIENIYEWNIQNWGTECDGWDVSAIQETDECIELQFQSAWDPPLALYEYMKENGYIVIARFWDNHNARFGTWEDGQVHELVCNHALDLMERKHY